MMKTNVNPLKRKRDDLSDLEQNTLGLNILPPDILKLIGSYLNPNAIFNLTRTLRYLHILPSEENTNTPASIMMFNSLLTSFNRIITRIHGETIIDLLYDLGYFVEEKCSLLLSGSTMIQVVSPENNFGFTDLDLYVKSGKMN